MGVGRGSVGLSHRRPPTTIVVTDVVLVVHTDETSVCFFCGPVYLVSKSIPTEHRSLVPCQPSEGQRREKEVVSL